MSKLAVLSSALVAAAIFAAPAIAREHRATPRQAAADSSVAVDAYAGPARGTYSCVAAPRVGAFATQPWATEAPCVPGPGY